MRIECKILNTDTVAEKLNLDERKIWANFVGDTANVHSFMEYLEENEPVPGTVEVWWNNGKACIFETFKNEMRHSHSLSRSLVG